MPSLVINVLVHIEKAVPKEQEENLLSRIEDSITDACKEYGIGEPSMCLAQYDDWMERG